MICIFCKLEVGDDMPGHYAGDNCTWLLEAGGAVTEAGKLREKTFGNLCQGMSAGDKQVAHERNVEKWAATKARVFRDGRKRQPRHKGSAL